MNRLDTAEGRIRRRRTAVKGNVLALAICLSFSGPNRNHEVHALSFGNVRSKLLPGNSRRIIPTPSRSSGGSSTKPADARLLVAAAHHLGRYPWGSSSVASRTNKLAGTSTSRMLHSGTGTGAASSAAPSSRQGSSALSATEPDAETQLAQLKQENDILRLQLTELEEENLRLHKHGVSPENIIIERFEGERTPIYDDNGEEILPWYEREDDEDGGSTTFTEVLPGQKALVAFGDNSTEVSSSPESESAAAMPDLAASLADGGAPTSSSSSSSPTIADGECTETPYDGLTCPIEPDVSFGDALRDRAYWLCGLLAMQSLSGFILARNEVLLQNHPVIVYFLTMLVGAGGNAGNQASVRVIRGLALGTLNESTQRQFLNRELKMAVCLCGLLSTAGFLRAAAFRTPLPETIAITCSLALIVFSSIGLGAVLPLVLQKLRVDPAHSSTTIQVIMDILGVVMTVLVSTLMLDSPMGQYIVSKLAWS